MMSKLFHRNFIYPGLVIALGFTMGCGQLAPNSPKDIRAADISASINLAHTGLVQASLSKIVLEVSGAGIDTIRKELTLEAGGAKGQLEVPAGEVLTFKATAYVADTPVLSGSTQYKPEGGKTATVQITLNFLVPALIITPPTSSISKDSLLTVYIQARYCTDLGTIGTKISFDNTKLAVTDLGREDEFLKSNSGSINQLRFSKDNDNGTVDIVLGIFPASAAVSGDGKIGRIIFKALESGTVNLTVSLDNSVDSDLGIFDKNANLVNALALGSSIVIQ